MRDLYDFRAKSAVFALGLVAIVVVIAGIRELWGWLAS